MTHPAPGGPVTADIGEALLVVPVGRAERNLLDGLVHDHTLVGVRHSDTERRYRHGMKRSYYGRG